MSLGWDNVIYNHHTDFYSQTYIQICQIYIFIIVKFQVRALGHPLYSTPGAERSNALLKGPTVAILCVWSHSFCWYLCFGVLISRADLAALAYLYWVIFPCKLECDYYTRFLITVLLNGATWSIVKPKMNKHSVAWFYGQTNIKIYFQDGIFSIKLGATANEMYQEHTVHYCILHILLYSI